MRVRFSALAVSDLTEIKRYVSKDRPSAAARLLRAIRHRIMDTIAHFPESGEACDHIAPGLRRFTVGNYLILYRVTDRIEVVRVLHGARGIERLF
jgi:toxin ParE1/3/4